MDEPLTLTPEQLQELMEEAVREGIPAVNNLLSTPHMILPQSPIHVNTSVALEGITTTINNHTHLSDTLSSGYRETVSVDESGRVVGNMYYDGFNTPYRIEAASPATTIRGRVDEPRTQISDDFIRALAEKLSISTDVVTQGDKLIVDTKVSIELDSGELLFVDAFEGLIDISEITN